MAAQQTPASASIVGNAFVNRYYNILHQSPHVLHRFYMDESRLSRAGAHPNATVDTAETMAGIHNMITSLDYGGIRAEIKAVDSQQSSTGSVLVMVTGSLFSESRGKRDFVQTFLLTPRERTQQEKSYYVLNDMFRYLDGEVKPSQSVSPVANGNVEPPMDANITSDQGLMESTVSHNVHSSECSCPETHKEVSAEDSYELPEHPDVSDIEEGTTLEDGDMSAAKPNEVLEAGDEPLDVRANKSYASILRRRKNSSGASIPGTLSSSSKSAPIYVEQSTLSAPQAVQAPSQSSMGTSHMLDQIEESSVLENEGDSRSVYVKNLPLNVTTAELEEEFSKFGELKLGGINLRNQKPGVCFAFVEFEEASSVQCATEASPITIGGRKVYVEEKRPMPFRGGRGRFNQGRSYQSDGMRGRGYFNGRGIGRGGQESDKDFRARGNGTGRGGVNLYTSSGTLSNAINTNGNGNYYRAARRAPARNGIAVAAA